MRKTVRAMSAVFLSALLIGAVFCGCDGDKRQPDSGRKSTSAEQRYPVGSYERRAAEIAASGAENPEKTVLHFGEDSVFGGIRMESDENGEIICVAEGEALYFKTGDERFPSYNAFSEYVRRHAGTGEMRRLSGYFCEKNAALYFVDGADGRGIKSSSRYYLDDASKLTVSAIHTADSRKGHGAARSEIVFTRKDGIWMLVELTVLRH